MLDASLVISELVADNDGSLLDQNGTPSDWVEIFNSGATQVSLSGMYLTDDADDLTKWRFPDVRLDAGEHRVVFASGNDLRDISSPLHASFKLDDEGDQVMLVDTDGRAVIDSVAFGRQVSGLSYGRGQPANVTQWITSGAPAEYLIPEGPMSADWAQPDFDARDWSQGSTALGYELGAQLSAIAYQNRLGSVGTQNYTGALGMDFVVHKPITVTHLGVFDSGADGVMQSLTAQMWSRRGNSGTLLATERFTRSDPGELIESDRFQPLTISLNLSPGEYTIVAYGYGSREPNGNAGTGGPDDQQKLLNDGNGVLSFEGGSRYGAERGAFPTITDGGPVNRYSAGTFRYSVPAFTPRLGTDLESEMSGKIASAYLRIPFEAGDLQDVDRLRMHVSYDDGFVAYLNGVEVARRNAPERASWLSTATSTRSTEEVLTPEVIDVSARLGSLRPGQNILAIQALNFSPRDDDFLIDAELKAIDEIGDATFGYFAVATPGALNSAVSYEGLTTDPVFSQQRGFYEDGFDVTIQTETPDATIVYTTDGSTPAVNEQGTITNGRLYAGPLRVDQTSALRAVAWKSNYLSSTVVTQTYLFLDDVVNQSNRPAGYPSRWGSATADYGMSQNADDLPLIAGDESLSVDEAKNVVRDSLLALPTMSIVMPVDDLFDLRDGIYANPASRGNAWERAASVEYLLPNGDTGFHINAGIQIMGGTSRNLGLNIKQSFRLVFKEEYGPGRLEYPFFPGNPVSRFNTLALRTNSRDNWTSSQYTTTSTYLRDEWSKLTQAEMGQLATSGRFVHLYINGMYWGIYNPTERPDAAFVASHTGADEKAIDTVKFCCPQRVVDGSLKSWNELRALAARGLADDAAYQRIQGNNPDGTRNPDYEVLIDIDNFIDYVINGQFSGSEDWPGNYYVARDRGPDSRGFRFFTWDNDLAFRRADKVSPDPNHNWWTESPGELDIALRENAEYRMRFADHVQQHFFNEGALTSEAATERWDRLADALREALIAESARWGDYRRDVAPAGSRLLYTPHGRWESNLASVRRFLERRPARVLAQLRAHGLYPDVDAPVFSQHGGNIVSGERLEISAPETVYLTTDGSDPRQAGGAVATVAVRYEQSLTLTKTTHVKARTYVNGSWSALTSATFVVSGPGPKVVVSEINYHPHEPSDSEIAAGFQDSEAFEFIELMNAGNAEMNLDGLRLAQVTHEGETQGIDFDFSSGSISTLAPGERLLVVENAEAFAFRYGDNLPVAGQYSGRLSNGGELITLEFFGEKLQQFAYSDDWHRASDGRGSTLEMIDPSGEPSLWSQAFGWRASRATGGSPGFAGNSSPAPGDSNHDGVFDSTDLVLVFVAGEYEDDTDGNSTFEEGDWNGDGDFTSSDLVTVFQTGAYVSGAVARAKQALEQPRQLEVAIRDQLFSRLADYRWVHSSAQHPTKYDCC